MTDDYVLSLYSLSCSITTMVRYTTHYRGVTIIQMQLSNILLIFQSLQASRKTPLPGFNISIPLIVVVLRKMKLWELCTCLSALIYVQVVVDGCVLLFCDDTNGVIISTVRKLAEMHLHNKYILPVQLQSLFII